jgi:vitamin B12 transporter
MLTQAYYNPAHFYLNGISKVEISKGQQSSLYGSDAIGGVISLETKKADQPFSASYLQEIGSYYTYTEQLDLEGKNNKLGCALSVLRLDSRGFSTVREKEANHERDPYHNMNVSLRTDYEINENFDAGLIGRFIYAKYEYDGDDPTTWLPADDNDRYGYNHEGMGTIFLNHTISGTLRQRFQIAWTRFYRQYLDYSDTSVNDWYDAKTYQAEWKLDYDICTFYKFLLGADYVREKGDFYSPTGDFPKSTVNDKSVFVENIFTPLEPLMLSFSYRRDDHSSFGGADSKRATTSYLIEKTATKIKGSYGEGFKAPSMYQLYAPASVYGPIGNNKLVPEKSKTYEVGIEQKLFDKLTLEANYFRTFFRNLIDFVSGSGYVNISKARIYGIETELGYRVNNNLNMQAGYTWLDTENKENHAVLERRPKNKINLNVNANFDKWETHLGFSYVGHRTQGASGNTLLKPYSLLDASVFYHWNKNLDIFLRGENLLDKDYELVDHYQVKRISFYAGFNAKF